MAAEGRGREALPPAVRAQDPEAMAELLAEQWLDILLGGEPPDAILEAASLRPGDLRLAAAAALLLADQYLLPTFTPAGEPPYVQYVFRGLLLIVALAVLVPRMMRRKDS